MKIKYCEYGEKLYFDITMEELKNKIKIVSEINCHFIVLNDVKYNTLYFSEIDAYDY